MAFAIESSACLRSKATKPSRLCTVIITSYLVNHLKTTDALLLDQKRRVVGCRAKCGNPCIASNKREVTVGIGA
ncbi:hypothetical protein LIA77_10480 [Sarocladium implicatum]|nr:hypothetical protein LIA77_10480 [Sarocladium implicatum]